MLSQCIIEAAAQHVDNKERNFDSYLCILECFLGVYLIPNQFSALLKDIKIDGC